MSSKSPEAAGIAEEGASNMSANGFPNCNKSSEAFVAPTRADVPEELMVPFPVDGTEAAPNKSTIGAPAAGAAVGDDKKGFVRAALAPSPPLVGDDNFD